MAAVTEREIKRLLRDCGWSFVHGTKHDMAVKDGHKIAIPRHKGDIPLGTAKAILKEAMIADKKEGGK